MAGGMSRMAKRELLASIQHRYQGSSKRDKGRILDEFIAVTGHHRKHGIRLLGQTGDSGGQLPGVKGRRIYDEAVREAVILVWEASDRICGKRLKAALPHMVESMESHGHLDLDPEIRERLLAASAATLDRLLKPVRVTVASRRKRRRNLSPGPEHPGPDLRRLEPPSAWLPGDRPGCSLRGQHGRVVHLQPGGHRYLHWMDRGGTPIGSGAVPGGDRIRGHRQTAALYRSGHRFRQRQRVHQRHPYPVLR